MKGNKVSSVWIVFVCITNVIILSFPSSAMAANNLYRRQKSRPALTVPNEDTSKIQLVLEDKIENQGMLKKIKGKLLNLDSEQIRLISSLCEQIYRDGQSAGADFAFLLVATLNIFSSG